MTRPRVEIIHEYDPYMFEAHRRALEELKRFARKVRRLFNKIKIPGKNYVKRIQVTPIASAIQKGGSVARAYEKSGTIEIGQYTPYGEAISDAQLVKNIKHEVAHIYWYRHPHRLSSEKFALRWETASLKEIRRLLR